MAGLEINTLADGLFHVATWKVVLLRRLPDDLGGPVSRDVSFLVLGTLLVIGGWALHRRRLAAMGRPAGALAPDVRATSAMSAISGGGRR